MRAAHLALLLGSCLALSCAGLRGPWSASDDEIPRGQLPDHVRPLHYQLELAVDPEGDVYLGRVIITLELDREVRTIWMHGRDLRVASVLMMPDQRPVFRATWEQLTEDGVAAVRLPEPVGPGEVRMMIAWAAYFGRTLRGLHRVDVGDDAYLFSQLEPISARRVFPCFDEPRFKTPFDVSVVAPQDVQVIATTPVEQKSGMRRQMAGWRFETTPKLPTYLLAWAVGPLDVVEAPPLPPGGPRSREVPFRGVATRGRGAELAYALEHTPAIVADLERYFDREYPYRKLDVIAVPDFSAGAMENVGAIMFREYLLLLDPVSAPEEQRRGFTYVMAHELAHQWFGDLVTMVWWNDLWLNEAFATWLGSRTVEDVRPEQGADVILLEHVLAAMDADSLTSARSIRQPIESDHDILNAFDAITYSKGAGVLGMFERWLGEETFRDGIRRYIAAHADGSATAADLLAALSEASGRDVATPFDTFLTQPGVPFIEMETRCDGERPELALRQSRYLPVGSRGDRRRRWEVPLCVRYAAGGEIRETCTLLDDREGRLALDAGSCPDWVMPNAEAAGYYRFSQPTADADRLLARGLPALSTRERLVVADSLSAALHAATRPAGELYPALGALAVDPERAVATAPMAWVRTARDYLADDATRPGVERFGRELYGPRLEQLGWQAAPDEDGDTRLLRQAVVGFLALVARDPEVRREAERRGRLYAGIDGAPRPEALEPELVEPALAVTVQEGGVDVFDALEAQLFESEDALVRGRRLSALADVEDPELAARARALALDPRLRVNEAFTPLWRQAGRPETRAATWRFVEENFDALVERVGPERASSIPWMAAGFCSTERAKAVHGFLAPRIDALSGGPRNLAGAVEKIRLCAALVKAQAASARAFFASR